MKGKAVDKLKKKFNAHRQYQHIYFKSNDMDFAFQWFLGSTAHGGAGIGESYYAASRIREKDTKGWESEFTALAGRVRKRGDKAFSTGHSVSASDSYLRAAMYYRAVLASLLPSDPRFSQTIRDMKDCFHKGSALLKPAVERFDIPFEGKILTGYFQKTDIGSGPRPTLLMIGGAETFAEDLYYYIAPAAIKRGWNFATADLPGQGDTPLEGLFFRADTETPVKAIIDRLTQRPDVDTERLALYGISAGGYFVPRAAVYDKRIKACIANSMLYKFFEIWNNSSIPKFKSKVFLKIAARKAPFALRMVQLVAWRLGLDPEHLYQMIEKVRDYSFDPALIECPTLILVGEGEYQNPWSREQQDNGLAAVSNPRKKLIVGPFNEGSASHCFGENVGLMSSFVFDWLDEVL